MREVGLCIDSFVRTWYLIKRMFTWTWNWILMLQHNLLSESAFLPFFVHFFLTLGLSVLSAWILSKKKSFHTGNDPFPFNQRLHFISIDRLKFFWGLPSILLEKQGYKLDDRSNKIHNKSHFRTSAQSSSTPPPTPSHYAPHIPLSLKTTVR